MKNVTVGLLGAAAVATTVLLVRQQREAEEKAEKEVRRTSPDRSLPTLSLERMREAGL